MITGAHSILYSKDAEGLRDFIRDKLGFQHVDAGRGWLIFALPPAELAVHPTDGKGYHELYLLCDDIRTTMAELKKKGVEFTGPVREERWGSVTAIKLPDGGELGLYQPKHALAPRG
jgi:catechol 2,3-dioxygenase-like lactoylglutathione lyase family enzyme